MTTPSHLAGLSDVSLHIEVVGELLSTVLTNIHSSKFKYFNLTDLARDCVSVLLRVRTEVAHIDSGFLPWWRPSAPILTDWRDQQRLSQLPLELDVMDIAAVTQELNPRGERDVTLIAVSVGLVFDVQGFHFLVALVEPFFPSNTAVCRGLLKGCSSLGDVSLLHLCFQCDVLRLMPGISSLPMFNEVLPSHLVFPRHVLLDLDININWIKIFLLNDD